ncbi:MAG: class I SAM-dependent methyltransferase [Promethearchaeota archaeon]|nr:MAG: class I SAM-dependent methyltransferase [Candidatus Lokiarchaeota archaeon]
MTAWDEIFKKSGRVFQEPHPKMDELREMFQERDFDRILDLGCGTGRHLVYFSKKGFKMYGFDSSPNAIKQARRWLGEENLNAEITVHKMENKFPFPSNYFDAVISIQVIHHNKLEVIKMSVKEIERVIKKGGIIFISFPVLRKFSKKNRWKLEEIEERTFLPLDGPEKGLPHHFFLENEIYEVFNKFKILRMELDGTNHKYIIAEKI